MSEINKEEELKEHKKLEGTEQKVFDIKDVEIFSSGTWNGDKYTNDDLDSMVSAFHSLGDKIKPFIKLGHSEKQKLLQQDGYPSAGWITGLKRNGSKLVADMSGIPKKIYELIKNKAFGRWSSEIYWNIKENGQKHKRVLKAVALLGADTPAVTNLDDFINLYELDEENLKEYIVNENTIEAETKEYENLEKEANDMPEIKELEKKLEDTNSKLEETNSALEQSKKDYSDAQEKLNEIKTNSYKETVLNYLEDKTEKGLITPAQKQIYCALAMNDVATETDGLYTYSYAEGDEKKTIEYKSSFDLVKKAIDNKTPEVDLDEKSEKGKETEKKTYSKKNESEDKQDDFLVEKSEEYIKENPDATQKEAMLYAGREWKSKNGGTQ